MRVEAVAGATFALTGCVLFNAFYRKEQFYPSVVYITKSNPSMAVIYVQALVLVVLFGKLMRKLFFGQLRAAETEHLIERSWYAVTETCLAFTVFRDDFSFRFIGLFTALLFLKCFHWLVEDRVDFMERSPVISLVFHLRVVLLLSILSALDMLFVSHAYHSTLIKGASVQLVFGFEYAILLTVAIMISVKYVLHTIDLRSQVPWENKSVFLLYSELFLGFAKVVLYILFMGIMIKVHTLPLFAIRPMYLTTRAFKKAVHDIIMSRRAIRNMNTLYPNATQADLESTDNICIICREEMHAATDAAGANVALAKKLPCGHIFHTSCLRSWFQRQQTCPTCRIDILRNTGGNRAAGAAGRGAAAAAAAARNDVRAAPAAAVPNAPQAAQAENQAGAAAAAAAAPAGPMPPFPFFFPPPPPPPPTTSTASNTANTAVPHLPPPPPPPFFGSMPFPMGMPPFPFPPPPSAVLRPSSQVDLSKMTVEELRVHEGEERAQVEERIRILRNIHSLLDAAMAQMNQYVASTSPSAAASASTGNDSETPSAAADAPTAAPPETAAPAEVPAPDASTGAVPKLRSGKKQDEPVEEPEPSSTGDVGEGDAGKDDASELRRRRLEKLVTDSPTPQSDPENEQ